MTNRIYFDIILCRTGDKIAGRRKEDGGKMEKIIERIGKGSMELIAAFVEKYGFANNDEVIKILCINARNYMTANIDNLIKEFKSCATIQEAELNAKVFILDVYSEATSGFKK